MRPSSTKGTYMKGMTLNGTMGLGVPLDVVSISN
jgi:ribosomal protein L1